MLAALLFGLLPTIAALAHPHIWVSAKGSLQFDAEGRLVRIHHVWTFDEAFSAWSTQGLDINGDAKISPEEMQELADQSLNGLSEYDYYTFAGEGAAADIKFKPGTSAKMTYDGKLATLEFDIEPIEPVRIDRELEIEVNDPEYYVAFTFDGHEAMVLDNPPVGCVIDAHGPGELDDATAQRLYAIGADVRTLPPDLEKAVRAVANLAVLTCPPGAKPAQKPIEATTATQAAAQVAATRAPPLGAPAAEPGLPMPRTGFLGWVNVLQQQFYAALTSALGDLKRDNNAFWVLGALSFLYGIFHAAGPGHGKLVITSYVLATRADLQRGVALSFASAMLQSLTAILFVSIASAGLHLTALAMSGATDLITKGSFVMMTLLGLWLLANKLLGKGHHHHHAAADDHGHNHEHDHDHDHPHPQKSRSDWRQALGVIVSVGIRPCSGALIVLVFSLTQGVLLAGIAATFLMGIGTALSVSVLAMLAVALKGGALKLGGGRFSAIGEAVVWWLELAGALVVLLFGLILLLASFA